MRKISMSLLLLLTIYTGISYGQLSAVDYSSDDFAQFKASKTYFVKTGSAEFDKEMQDAMKETWKITSYEVLESGDLAKKITDKSSSFILPVVISTGTPNQNYHYLALINGGKKKLASYSYDDMLAYSPINYFAGESENTNCAFRVRNMLESIVRGMDLVQKKDIKGSSKKIVDKLREEYNLSAPKIKGRTLLVNEDQIGAQYLGKKGKRITKQEFGGVYPFKFEFVSQARIAEVIQQRSTEYYYIQLCATLNKSIFVVDPSNGEIVYFNYKIMGMDLKDNDVEDIKDAIDGKK